MIIKKGSQGSAVKKIQHKLGETPDGIFGSGTEQRVKDWQTQNGLTSDGLIGGGSWQQMFGCSMDELSPIGIIVHSMTEWIDWEGKEIHARELLSNLKLSVHALIHPDGKVEEILPPSQKAAHAGKSLHNGIENLNGYTLGFELLVSGNNDYGTFINRINDSDCYTEEQFQAAVNLTKSWMNQFQIPKEDVVRHSDVSGDSVRGDGKGKVDPGNGFDWKRFIESI